MAVAVVVVVVVAFGACSGGVEVGATGADVAVVVQLKWDPDGGVWVVECARGWRGEAGAAGEAPGGGEPPPMLGWGGHTRRWGLGVLAACQLGNVSEGGSTAPPSLCVMGCSLQGGGMSGLGWSDGDASQSLFQQQQAPGWKVQSFHHVEYFLAFSIARGTGKMVFSIMVLPPCPMFSTAVRHWKRGLDAVSTTQT